MSDARPALDSQHGAASTPAAATLLLAILSSVPASLPAWVRVLPATPPFWAALALVGSVSLLVAPTSLWLRRAVEAGIPPADRALASGVALSALPLALFGGVLKSTTHHRPLGAATFAVAALCLLALSLGLGFRVFVATEGGNVPSTWRNLFTLGCGLSLVSGVLLGVARTTGASLMDFLALAAAVGVAGLVRVPAFLARPRLGPVLIGWAALVICAVVSLHQPDLVRSLTTQAPVSFGALSWLGGGF